MFSGLKASLVRQQKKHLHVNLSGSDVLEAHQDALTTVLLETCQFSNNHLCRDLVVDVDIFDSSLSFLHLHPFPVLLIIQNESFYYVMMRQKSCFTQTFWKGHHSCHSQDGYPLLEFLVLTFWHNEMIYYQECKSSASQSSRQT